MSTFRQYGGINYAATNNIVRNNISNSNNLGISNILGLPNTNIIVDSTLLDASGNTISGGGSSSSGNTTINGTLSVSGATTLSDSLSVSGATTLSSTLNVSGVSTFDGAIIINYDNTNQVLGYGASTSFGTNNTGFGYNVLASANSNSYFNTAFGSETLFSNTTGYANTAIGTHSLKGNIEGNFNTSIGEDSLYNTTGSANVAVGVGTGLSNVTGNNNTFIGTGTDVEYDAPFNNSTALGYGAIIHASNQIVLGTSNANVYIPSENINTLTIGLGGGSINTNTALGYQALTSNTTGSNNTAFGYETLFSNTSGFANTAIGIHSLRGNTEGNFNTSIGEDSLIYTTGSENVAVGVGTGISNVTGNNNTFIGTSADVEYDAPFNNSTALGYGAIIHASNQIVLGDSNVTSVTTAASVTASSFTSTSDYRIKENVSLLNGTFSVDNLRPVTYQNKLTKKQDIGFIAHEVQEVFPYLVNGDKNGETNQSLNYNGLIGVLVKEIQDLKQQVNNLKTDNQNFKNVISEIIPRILK